MRVVGTARVGFSVVWSKILLDIGWGSMVYSPAERGKKHETANYSRGTIRVSKED